MGDTFVLMECSNATQQLIRTTNDVFWRLLHASLGFGQPVELRERKNLIPLLTTDITAFLVQVHTAQPE